MRLSNFIRGNIEVILQEWEDFAVTLHPLADANKVKLRDHAQQMLKVICADLDTFQCEQESVDKSKGIAPNLPHDTAAETHAEDRLQSGFNDRRTDGGISGDARECSSTLATSNERGG